MELQLRGQPSVVLAGGQRIALAPRDGVLLAWLALEAATPRQRMAQLLWPDSGPEAARNALRQRLFQLRRQLGFELVIGSSSLSLAPTVRHDLAHADTLLDGVHLQLDGELSAWLVQQRTRCLSRRQDRLRARSDELEKEGRFTEACDSARDLLLLEPFSELAHARVMRLAYLAGDRAAALLAFDHCERVLKEEVGTRPSPATLALLGTIEAAAPLTQPRAKPSLPASVLRPPRLIGRQRELSVLAGARARAQVAALVGEAGMGKTRLAHEFLDSEQKFIHAAARPGDAAVPFAFLTRLLHAASGYRKESLLAQRNRLGVACSDSGRMQGARTDLMAALAPAGGNAADVLANEVKNLGAVLCDDLHFADEASLDFLAGLLSEQRAGPGSFWLLAYRPAEAETPLQGLHEILSESANLLPIRLAPLDCAALAELVDSLQLPGLRGEALAQSLHQHTGGNPLYVLETLKQAWVDQSLSPQSPNSALPHPPSVERLLMRRIGQLSSGALALARLAAIAGNDFSVALAERVLGVNALRFADALAELEAAHVLRGAAFDHDLIYETVHASVPRAIAEHLHAQVAVWLEEVAGEPARIARHWLEAQQKAKALPWLGAAAEKARAALRSKEFLQFMEQKCEIEAALGDHEAAFVTLLAAFDEYVNVDRTLARGLAYLDQLQALAVTPERSLRVQLKRAHLHQQQGEFSRAEACGREALRAATVLSDSAAAIEARRAIGVACLFAQRFAEASEHLAACSHWLDEHGTVAQRSEIHGELAVLYDNLGRLDDALPHHQLTTELAWRAGLMSNASVACGNYACNRIDAGDLAAAETHLVQGQQLLAAYDEFGAHRGLLQLLRSLVLCHLGRPGDALVQAELGVEAMRAFQPGYLAFAELRLGACWAHLGQWARLRQILARVEGDARKSSTAHVLRARLAFLAARAGSDPRERPQAREAIEEALASLGDSGRPDLRWPLLLDLALDLPAEEALEQTEAVRAQARASGHFGTLLATWVREAAFSLGLDPQRAARAADEARGMLRGRRQTVALAPGEAPLHLVRAYRAAGRAKDAGAVLGEAVDTLRRAAERDVPASFRESFLRRVPAHRELFDLARPRPA